LLNRYRWPLGVGTFATALLAAAAAPAGAATWHDWWLPYDYSAHGPNVDWLFNVVFWITMGIFVLVEVLLVWFAIKYRYRPERNKGIFCHGNTKLEMAWTIAPAIVLIWISLATKRVWDEFRYGNANDADRVQLLVIGQQFKWNFIYPGPDGKVGSYLHYPKVSDPEYAHRPAKQAADLVATELNANPLGQRMNAKDAKDPGLDDDYVPQPGRPLIVPAHRPLEIFLGSRDVLHSFFLPNFRVKLDAVPGMKGRILFKATKTSTVSEAVELVPEDKKIWLDSSTPKAFVFGNPASYQIFDPKVISPDASDPYAVDPNSLKVDDLKKLTGATSRDMTKRKQPWLQSLETSLRDGAIRRLRDKALQDKTTFDPQTAPKEVIAAEVMALRQDLKRMGIAQLTYVKEPFEIVCEELCGSGHAEMNGTMIVVSPDQYARFINKVPPGTVSVEPAATASPSTAPTTPASQPTAATAPASHPSTAPASQPVAAVATIKQ
jgi:heme/copper-type cytochrome/quinol oxidase subunit 2